MLAALGFMGLANIHPDERPQGVGRDMHQCHGRRHLHSFGRVGLSWHIALAMAGGSIAGGYGGAGFARRIGKEKARAAVVVIGFLVAALLLFQKPMSKITFVLDFALRRSPGENVPDSARKASNPRHGRVRCSHQALIFSMSTSLPGRDPGRRRLQALPVAPVIGKPARRSRQESVAESIHSRRAPGAQFNRARFGSLLPMPRGPGGNST